MTLRRPIKILAIILAAPILVLLSPFLFLMVRRTAPVGSGVSRTCRVLWVLGAVLAVFVVAPIAWLYLFLISLGGWPWPPSDDHMIAHLQEHRPAFEALVAKLGEGRATGRIAYTWMDSGAKVDGWIDEVRDLMRAVDAEQVSYLGRDDITITYALSGLRKTWYKTFRYRHTPLDSEIAIIDLHGPEASARARAALCDPERPAHLAHLCQEKPWVNDLDVLFDHDSGATWHAERPIDAHWSLYMMYLQ